MEYALRVGLDATLRSLYKGLQRNSGLSGVGKVRDESIRHLIQLYSSTSPDRLLLN